MRSERVVERVLERGCAGCGTPMPYRGTGRRPRYCRAACRKRAWALRHAEQALGTPGDTRPTVVREVVERVIERIVEPRVRNGALVVNPSPPVTAPDWQAQLAILAAQLRDPAHLIASEHWHHRRLLRALTEVVQALDAAHPGGLGRRRR